MLLRAAVSYLVGGGAAGPKAPVNQHNPHIASISPKSCLVIVLPGLDELGTPFPSFAGYRVRLGPVLEAMCEDLERYVVSEARRRVYGGLQAFVVKVGHWSKVKQAFFDRFSGVALSQIDSVALSFVFKILANGFFQNP